ncbi:glycosyltransferase family protein [Actinomycetota bacterium]
MSTRARPGPADRRRRVALYGHDTQGLGHLRRNLALGSAYARGTGARHDADVLLMTGAAEVGMFPRPRGLDAIVLPGVRKDVHGEYAARSLRADLDDVLALRRATLRTALRTFAPDVLIVDKAPWGFAGELTETLYELRERGTRLVLGLRDVLDEPATAAAEWAEQQGDLAVTELYEEVWIYGDATVHDVVSACGMTEVAAAKTRYVGYLASDRPDDDPNHRPLGDTPYVLVTSGGGQDGARLVEAASRMGRLPGAETVILTGPQMDPATIAAVRAAADERPGVHVMRFSRHSAAWIGNAEAVVAMGGANTVAEILASSTPALIVPRVTPRREQLVRASALSRWGAVEMLHPDDLTPAALTRWLRARLGGSIERTGLALDGIDETVHRLRRLVGLRQPIRVGPPTDPRPSPLPEEIR